jgi:ankyrin repeat protein
MTRTRTASIYHRRVVADASQLMRLMRAIAAGDTAFASQLLSAQPALASARLEQGATRRATTDFFLDDITHYVYGGDSALHVAAASYRRNLARALMSAGADVSARNRRGAQPLHYAADGVPGSGHWDPHAQAATVAYLIDAGADPNATDDSGVAPLHRAVRTRCAAAVNALLDGGADPRRANKSGSTPMTLATHNTGRGGSGSAQAMAEQVEIVRLLVLHGASQ